MVNKVNSQLLQNNFLTNYYSVILCNIFLKKVILLIENQAFSIQKFGFNKLKKNVNLFNRYGILFCLFIKLFSFREKLYLI